MRVIFLLIVVGMLAGCGDSGSHSVAASSDRPTVEEGGNSNTGSEMPASSYATKGERLVLDQAEALPDTLEQQDITPLRDDQGRQLVLNGINSGSGKDAYMRRFWEQPEDLAHESVDFGYNAFRYLIFWDHVMPSRGVINTDYLDDIASRLDWLEKQGMHVILDMHQDNWGQQCGGNGAPGWATKGEADPAPGAPWWIMAASPCVVDSANAFFNNDDDVQGEFAAAWQAVAARFADHPAVLGYDLMNEPTQIDAIVDQMVHDMLDGTTTGLLNFATIWTAWPVWSD